MQQSQDVLDDQLLKREVFAFDLRKRKKQEILQKRRKKFTQAKTDQISPQAEALIRVDVKQLVSESCMQINSTTLNVGCTSPSSACSDQGSDVTSRHDRTALAAKWLTWSHRTSNWRSSTRRGLGTGHPGTDWLHCLGPEANCELHASQYVERLSRVGNHPSIHHWGSMPLYQHSLLPFDKVNCYLDLDTPANSLPVPDTYET